MAGFAATAATRIEITVPYGGMARVIIRLGHGDRFWPLGVCQIQKDLHLLSRLTSRGIPKPS
jgi:hypothetical protein